MTLLAHRGAQSVTRQELDLIPVPAATETYKPVSHYDLANTFRTISTDLLTDYILAGENYAIARQGNQLFACLTFKNGAEMGMSIGFRNSLDKSMSIGLAIGAKIFICDNMAFRGDICVMRKHSANVWTDLENLAITNLYKAQKTHEQIIVEADFLKSITLDNDQAYRQMGFLFGREIISPRQLPDMLENWQKPRYEEFQPRTAWSLYNAATEALKSSPPVSILEKHLTLHKVMTEGGEIWEQ